MAEIYYDSPLTGEQLDAAFLQMQNIQQTASQVQSNATAAAQSASQASQSANSASQSASQASTSAQSASESQSAAASSASSASESAKDAAASAASIEGDVEQAAASANAASQSATQAASSASAAAASASAAADSEDEVQANATAAQQAAASASASEDNAKASETAAASSAQTATGAASAAQTSETNAAESARQAAASVASIGDDVETSAANAQAAQQAASDASASAAAAEDAATRAEQIADFDPSDYATAAQGTKADTAVQSVNGKTGTAITLAAADVGAATAAQGALAATAVQPADLDDYAKAGDIPKKLPNPQALGIRLGSGGSATSYDGSVSRTVTITPEAIGAQPAGAASGGEVTLIANTGLTSWSQTDSCNSEALATGGYDMVGIVCLCNSSTASDEYSPIQWFPIPTRGQSRKYGLFCMDVNNSHMGEAQVRMISITNNGSTIQIRSDTPGYYYNWGNKGQDNTCAVPASIYGMKF